MKNRILKFAWAALAGVAALACSREASDPGEKADTATVRTVTFRAMGEKTKAQFGEKDGETWPTLWTANDSEVKLSLNYGSAMAAGVTPSEDFRSATFSATIDFGGVSAPYTYYSVSPSSVAKALSPSREAWKVSIPSVQTPSAGSPDESALIIAATSDTYQDADAASDVNLYFNHLTAYGCISLTGLDLTGKTVQAVELTATEPFVGDWYWKCESHELIDSGASSTLTISTNHPDNVWFGCAPVDMSNQVWEVSLITDAGTYSKFILFDGDNYQLQPGVVAVISVDMSTDDVEFTAAGSGSGSGTPVTVSMDTFSSISGYVDGDTNVSYEASQGDAQTAPVVNGDVIRIYQNGGLLTVVANNGKTITNVTIGSSMATSVQVRYDDGGFGSSNSITAGGTYCTGTISASTVVFKCVGTDKSHRLYLNSLSVTYGGSGSGSSQADPLLSETNYGCYLGTGLEWEYNPGTEQVTRSYDSAGFETYTLIKPSTVEELEITGYKKGYVKGDGNIPISVHWRRGMVTVLSQDYTMKIIKEDGPKVWLSDGTHGVIIKK